MVPELGVKRLKAIAARVQDEFGGDLTGSLASLWTCSAALRLFVASPWRLRRRGRSSARH